VRDSGLVHTLLGLPDLDAVLGHPVAGGSWEGLAIENLIAAAPEGTQAFFYRTAAGAEIDLVLDLPGGRRWAVEVKRSSTPTVSKGLHVGAADIQASEVFVAYPGDGEFPVSAGVTAAPLLALARRLALLG
jgi:predicted AAA+ superfamily ATPase